MLTTLSIAGASATALALYIAMHLLTAGVFAMPTHAYRQTASAANAALVCAHPQASSSSQGSARHCAGSQPSAASPCALHRLDTCAAETMVAYGASECELPTAALLTPASPRAP